MMPGSLAKALAAIPMGLACMATVVFLAISGEMKNSDKRCQKIPGVATVEFRAEDYPDIKKHYEDAIAGRGESGVRWPRILILDRFGDDDKERRKKLMRMKKAEFPPRGDMDRDEYPPAIGRGRGGPPLTRGWLPRGWKADIAYVDDSQNQAHGFSLGYQTIRWCEGQKFRYRWY